MNFKEITDKTIKEGPIRTLLSLGGLGYMGFHIFNNVINPSSNSNTQIPAVVGAAAGYFAGPLMMDKALGVIKKEGEENSFYSLITKYSAMAGGALAGGAVGKMAIDKFREKHPYKLLNEEELKTDAKKSDVSLGSAMVVPATVFALDFSGKNDSEDRYYERIGSGLVTGFAAHTLGPRVQALFKDFSWTPEDFEKIKSYDKNLATAGGAAAGGFAAFKIFQKYAFNKKN